MMNADQKYEVARDAYADSLTGVTEYRNISNRADRNRVAAKADSRRVEIYRRRRVCQKHVTTKGGHLAYKKYNGAHLSNGV